MKHKEKQEFDDYAHGYREAQDGYLSASGESSEFFAEYKIQKMKEWLEPKFSSDHISILDFGCGDGMMTKYTEKYFPKSKLYGTDPSSESIDIAKKLYPSIHFDHMADNLDHYENNTFDIIFAAGVFHHILFEEHEKYMAELKRILKPGGKMILFELNPLNPGTQYIFKNDPFDDNAEMLTPWYAKKICKPVGKLEMKYYCFYPKPLRWLRWTEPYLTWLPLGGLYACIVTKK